MLPTHTVAETGCAKEYAGALVIAPPSAAGSTWLRRFGDYATGFASGWMRMRGARRRRDYERGFVMSDHADSSALLASGAERVLATYGAAGALSARVQPRRRPAGGGLRRHRRGLKRLPPILERAATTRARPDLREPAMSRIVSAVPVLPAQDLDATLEFYRRRLRFRIEFRHAGYAAVSRDGVQIHFWQCPDRALAEASGCRLNVVGIDALYAECRAQEVVHPNGELVLQPWGLREFAILDCNGNLIRFAEHA